MKFTLSWLKDHLETDASLDAIAARLTALGLEVEGVEDNSRLFAPFTVAHVIEATQHPNADKLRVCRVDIGEGAPLQVVCGAPNARAGIKVVFARAGLTVPGTGLELKPTVIRGVESNGMLCSAREMGLGQDHDGIMELPADAVVGQPFAPYVGADDAVIEIKLTPNRVDALGVRGIARDLAAAGLGRLKPLSILPVASSFDNPISVRLEFPGGDNRACPLFIGCVLRGVKNGPAPDWMRRRLEAIGLRPISALVDVTNYMTIDLGRPLHVFDIKKLKGNLVVRPARAGEKFLALDGKTYDLQDGMTVIADDSGVVSLGGVMGGLSTGVDEMTSDVYIEAAYFDPVRTAATGRALGIQSDARYRFERGVDPAFVAQGLALAVKMITDMCGGAASSIQTVGEEPTWRREIRFRPERVKGLGGLDLPPARSRDILQSLGFTLRQDGDAFLVEPPSFRGDVEGEADLVEEVLRLHGYDAIPSVALPDRPIVARPALAPAQRRLKTVRRMLAARGFLESITYSFIPLADARLFATDGREPVRLMNPISTDLDSLRPSVLPALLRAAGRNAARGFDDLALFECGPEFPDDSIGGQKLVAALIRMGQTGPRHWTNPPRAVDAYDAKADALAALESLGYDEGALMVMDGAAFWYHPGRSGTVRLGPKIIIAQFGELHPAILKAFDLDGPVVAAEIMLDALPEGRSRTGRARPPLALSDYQPVERDFAFLLDRGTPADKLLRAVRGADKGLIAAVSLFDVYEGPHVGEDKKSLALSVRLEPKDRTLTEADIESVAQKIIAAAAKVGATLRS